MQRTALALAALALALAGCRAAHPEPVRWWKGNTHTHTLWSDGDGAPEQVVAWYRERGYDFLVLSDHNVLSQGERWFPVEESGRLTPARVDELARRFGPERVELRERDGRREMRLLTLPELRERFEQPGEFLLVQGEEVSDAFERKPVHVNALNVAELVEPQGGASVREVLQRNVDAVLEQGRRLGRPTLAHVNHPNFGWALTWEDVAHLAGERFFEVYNGHPAVRNHGDEAHPSLERMWDLALTLRLTELDLGLLYGVATDDAHAYHGAAAVEARPGRGWIQVRAGELEPAALIAALRRGEFYASSGVRLADFACDGRSYRVDVDPRPGETCTTRFVGTRASAGEPLEVGEVLLETRANPAVYRFRGDELYVRAVVVSSRPHPDPYAQGDMEQAWLQPRIPAAR